MNTCGRRQGLESFTPNCILLWLLNIVPYAWVTCWKNKVIFKSKAVICCGRARNLELGSVQSRSLRGLTIQFANYPDPGGKATWEDLESKWHCEQQVYNWERPQGFRSRNPLAVEGRGQMVWPWAPASKFLILSQHCLNREAFICFRITGASLHQDIQRQGSGEN